MVQQRLSKIMAQAGVASRRACEELIFEGRVTVNDEKVTLPQTHVDPQVDKIVVDGDPLGQKEFKVTYILNKPAGYVCSANREKHSRVVLDIFSEIDKRLFTVGRLDKDTEGLLIVTNDGEFANQVIHPRSNIEKEYLVKTDKEITHEHLVKISKGCKVEGTFVKPVSVKKVRRSTFRIVVKEGKKREVRLIANHADLKVHQLTRIRIGGLTLGDLAPGAYKVMTKREKDSIFL
ncbi:MAG: pseudouridine synthase [Chlamydiota bacterium]